MFEEQFRMDIHKKNDGCKEFRWIEFYKDYYYDDTGELEERYPLYGTVPKDWTEEHLTSTFLGFWMVDVKFVDAPSKEWCIKELKRLEAIIKNSMELQEGLTKIINTV